MSSLDIIKFLKRVDCFPNITIAYRILLTIPVTVASAERSLFQIEDFEVLLAIYNDSRMA